MSSVTAGAGKAPVLLFKTPTEPLEADPYHQTLSEDFEPYFVPVLAEEYHIDELRAVFREHERWEGVVITSRRGAEAWVQAAELEVEAKSRTRDPRTGE
jgi:uroporphyrinogen-III synthase